MRRLLRQPILLVLLNTLLFSTTWTLSSSFLSSSAVSRRTCRREHPHVQRRTAASTSAFRDDNSQHNSFPEALIKSLDLVPLIEAVARHTATKRGRDALLALVKRKPPSAAISSLMGSSSTNLPRRQLQIMEFAMASSLRSLHYLPPLAPIATSLQEVERAYILTEEARSLLGDDKTTTPRGGTKGSNDDITVMYPPLYGADSDPWDTTEIPVSDDDEWLELSAHAWTEEHLLQAEQVLDKLLQIKHWGEDATDGVIQFCAPTLTEIARTAIDEEDVLPAVYEAIVGTAEIVRIRSAFGKSLAVRLSGDRFSVLQLLRDKQLLLYKKKAKELDQEVVELQEEIDTTTQQILADLAQRVLGVADTIHCGLDVLARIDVIMAKAAYGCTLNGRIPHVSNGGAIAVDGFLHPVLAGQASDPSNVVPVDLQLSTEARERALIISGANGGGKTCALKSFGLVSVLTKLGIAIPVRKGDASSAATSRPQVDFFDEVLANVGDWQNLLDGESTWTSMVNSCALIIETILAKERNGGDSNSTWLVLLDELGSGTDPEAGGAVAQAILEELLSVPKCSIVATTHSPRLKALSFDSPAFGCASVLLDESHDEYNVKGSPGTGTFKRPNFRLEYGVIGESHALGAASRSKPSLPPRVLSRATKLLSELTEEEEEGGTAKGGYVLALTKSMEEQLRRRELSRIEMEELEAEARQCRRAMMALAGSFQNHIDRLDDRLEHGYQKLKEKPEVTELQVIGDTLSQVRVVKKQVMSQRERLATQGLKMLSIDQAPRPGNSVVIVAEGGKWDGITAEVVADSSMDATLQPTELLVKPSFSMEAWAWEDDTSRDFDPVKDRFLIVQRHELAVWDADKILNGSATQSALGTSIPDAKQKLNSLLSSLNSVSSTKSGESGKKKSNSTYRSSRERKAFKKKRK